LQKFSAMIIDDEAPARAVIRTYLKDCNDISMLSEHDNAFDGLKAINEQKPDLVFLDIQMPKMTGFEMLELLEHQPQIIFSTAFDQYALKAFELSAADYLLKPYSKKRFMEAVSKAKTFLQGKNKINSSLQKLSEYNDENIEHLQRIVVKDGSEIYIIPTSKLLRLEAQDDYVMLYVKDDRFLKQKTMKYFEKHLNPAEFVRIHRSHLIKLSFLKKIEVTGKESYQAILNDGTVLPISKSGYARLKDLINK